MNNIFDLMNEFKSNFSNGKQHKKNSSSKSTKRKFKVKKSISNLDFSSVLNTDENTSKSKKENYLGLLDFFNSFSKTVKEEFNKKAKVIDDLLDFICKSNKSSSLSLDEKYTNNIVAIETINKLGNENANPDQQIKISKYVGWGGLSNYFEKNEEFLKNILGDSFETSKASVNTAFYTNPVLVKFMWQVLLKLGFEKGRILEPSCGIGNFFKSCNEETYFNSKIIGIEMDKLTSLIAKNLFQSSEIINDRFENVKLKDESFDLAISNIPFGDFCIYDKETKNKSLIHDFFFLKSLRKVRDKGLIAFITSTGFMDKRNSTIRSALSEQCDFIGAIRLPNNTFEDTSVPTDIVFLQKNINKEISVDYNADGDAIESFKNNIDWIESFEYKDGLYINRYFIENPHMILGDISIGTNQFGKCLKYNKVDEINTKTLNKMLKYFPSEIYITPLDDSYMFEDDQLIKCNDTSLKDGEFTLIDNKIYQRQRDNLIPSSYTGERKYKLLKYIDIKENLKNIIEIQLNDCSDEELNLAQRKLNNSYDEFIKKYGYINSRKNKPLLSNCILYTLVSSLENYDDETKTYSKADIFNTRTIGAEKDTVVETLNDAIALSFATYADINTNFISKKLNIPEKELKAELLENNICFLDCEDDSRLIYRDEYLSGFVKEKLKVAEKKAKEDSRYISNVEALKVIIPEYITDISFNFSSTWIPLDIKKNFISSILMLDSKHFKMYYTELRGYKVKYDSFIDYSLNNLEWGTKRINSLEIVQKILNMDDLTLYDIIDDKRVKNIEQTQLALTIAEKWRNAFISYINNNPIILKKVTDIYNDIYNGFVERKYYNFLKNLNINKNITLRKHQLNAISRMIISKNNTLLLHSVGTGKSFSMIAYCEEMARIGLSKSKMNGSNEGIHVKNLIVLPNHLCKSGAFAKEYLRLYPQAKILATTSEDFKKANRRKIISKIALGDWTSIIIPVSVLGLIPLKPETEINMFNEDLKEIEQTIQFCKENEDRISLKSLEKMKENYQSKIKELNDRRTDNGLLFWEDLGITSLLIDEAQGFKNLFLPKRLNVAGANNCTSKKAQDLYNKIRYQESKFGEGTIIFATATPISNSLIEMYVMLKYLNKSALSRYKINSFDAFAANFAEVLSTMEIDPTGTGFRLNTRLAKFCNLPELISIFRQVADIVNIQDISDIKIPEHVTGGPIIKTVTASSKVKSYINTLVKRAEEIKNGSVRPNEDNMLKVTNDGRKVALAPRLVGINEPSPKLKQVSENISKLYKQYPEGTHLIFCDLGTPKFDGSYSAYDELKLNLINDGVPEIDIKYIHEGNTNEKRKKLISDFNEGKFKILIGSTAQMGEGTNFQKCIKSITHVDVPWKMSDIEQRNGRAFRFGNKWEEVYEFRYVVNSSFDAYSWQIIEFKSKYISQIISATSSSRVSEDLEDCCLTYEACKACAANNPKLLELANIRREISEIKVLQKAYRNQLIGAITAKQDAEKSLSATNKRLSILKKDYETLLSNQNYDFNIILDEKTYTDFEDAVKAFSTVTSSLSSRKIGEIYGLDINFYNDYGSKYITIGKGETSVGWKVTPKVLLKKIINVKTKLDEKIKELEKNKIRYTNISSSLEGKLINKFDKEERLSYLVKIEKEIEKELSL